MATTKRQILICDNHKEYPTPLITTFVFKGCELWCPYCGTKLGMFDGGTQVDKTDELAKREKLYFEKYSDYLHAFAELTAIQIKFNGQLIPPADLPEEEKIRLKELRQNGWKPGIEIEIV